MEYKRSESFRHELQTPVDIRYSCIVNQIAFTRVGKILDISPSGVSILVKDELTEEELYNDLTFSFCLHTKEIQTGGIVRWKKYHNDGFRYGVELQTTEQIEKLIIEELKLRRKQEVLEMKKNG
ncbi:MAG: PilZ domain-containing protein [Kurthia sp.]|nr:PilZ domain-containing protein [Candidatus Kurthia equi]